jgi:DMSO/TMAO reductase YedYZ heme-binding membrane subunit
VTTSVGWLGAVAGVLALAIAGISAGDDQTVRSVYIAMRVTAWAVLVPLALASLATGVLQALGTRWGLLRHYWVVTKLVITVIATAVLLLYTQTIDVAADIAAEPTWSALDRATLRSPTVIVHSGLALLLLLVTTVLAIFKPSGLTARGRRQVARDATSH